MKNIVANLKWIPEFYFIIVSLLWFHLSVKDQNPNLDTFVNFPAIILIVVFHIQLFLNDSILGKILSAVTVIASITLLVFTLGNLISYIHLDSINQLNTIQLSNIIILNFVMAFLMYKKYNTVKPVESVEVID